MTCVSKVRVNLLHSCFIHLVIYLCVFLTYGFSYFCCAIPFELLAMVYTQIKALHHDTFLKRHVVKI